LVSAVDWLRAPHPKTRATLLRRRFFKRLERILIVVASTNILPAVSGMLMLKSNAKRTGQCRALGHLTFDVATNSASKVPPLTINKERSQLFEPPSIQKYTLATFLDLCNPNQSFGAGTVRM